MQAQAQNIIGDIIFKRRADRDITQDEYGRQFNVSGPAVFKFEKGYVKPSLKLWMAMAKDAGLPEKRAVIVWAKAKLPREYQDYVELQSGTEGQQAPAPGHKGPKQADLSKITSREGLRKAINADKVFPKGLLELLEDDELWALYKPSGAEIGMLREIFSPLGNGSKMAYREGLRVLREFRSAGA